jgi:hypothetical protein
MLNQTYDGIQLRYPPAEAETAGWISAAIPRSIQLVEELWGLAPPQDCRIWVMTSPVRFVFQSAPWPWRLLLGSTFPFWLGRLLRTWPISAAWTQRYGERVAIGIKPPRLLELNQQAKEIRQQIGGKIYVEIDDPNIKVQQVTCHELVHACSASLKLPTWLNEGIATLTADHLLDSPTIRQDTLSFVRDFQPKAAPPSYRAMSRMDGKAIAYHGVRGYWLVRYLQAEHSGLLKRLFSLHTDGNELEAAILREQALDPDHFWQEIDTRVAAYFEEP